MDGVPLDPPPKAVSFNTKNISGAAYVFKRNGVNWAQEAYLKAPNSDGEDYFGVSPSLSGDTALVGAYGEDSNQTSITNGTSASADNTKCSDFFIAFLPSPQ